jgi:hypothetical protein
MKTGRYIRSSPVDDRLHRGHAYWEAHDFDGDGQMGYMRQACEDGELVELAGFPNVMVPRLPEDPPPYYKLYPEGRIVNFDGRRIPDPYFLSDNQYDFNRNFPYQWAPEPEQVGAGDYPGQRARDARGDRLLDQAPRDLHLAQPAHLRRRPHPARSATSPTTRWTRPTSRCYRQVEAWMKEHTGYPTVSGFHEFLYEPETPIKGDLTEYAYHQRGALAYVIELWDIFAQIGMKQLKPFVDVYTRLERKDFEALAKWDRDVNQGRVFRKWRKVKHPQLGDVEVGGLDLRVGISNPPFEKLPRFASSSRQPSCAWRRSCPRITLEKVKQEKLADGLTRIEMRVSNRGYLGSYGLASAKKLPHSEPLRLTIECEGVRLAAPSEPVVEIGHLDGWGKGLYNGPTIFAPWTRGNIHEKFVALVAEGRGRIKLRLGSCRVGYKTFEVEVG